MRLSAEEQASVMSFADIASAMGITELNARMIYQRAIRKLRARPESLRVLRELIDERERIRNGRY